MSTKAKAERAVTQLPRWAQEHIRSLEMQRDSALKALHDFRNEQTPSPIWYRDHVCTGEEPGPTEYRRYLQTRQVSFQIGPKEHNVVDVLWRADEEELQITGWHPSIVFRPWASNSLRLFVDKG